jgi:hypothetical protein
MIFLVFFFLDFLDYCKKFKRVYFLVLFIKKLFKIFCEFLTFGFGCNATKTEKTDSTLKLVSLNKTVSSEKILEIQHTFRKKTVRILKDPDIRFFEKDYLEESIYQSTNGFDKESEQLNDNSLLETVELLKSNSSVYTRIEDFENIERAVNRMNQPIEGHLFYFK